MPRLLSAALSVLLLLAGVTGVQAQGPGSYAHLQERFGMSVLVDASFVAPDGCQTILSAARGAPPGVALGHEIIPATVIVGPDPRGCSGQRVLRRVFGIGFGSILQNVQLFFVSQDGRILKTEKLAIQTGW